MKRVTRIEAGGAVGMVHGDKKPNAKDRKALGRVVAAAAKLIETHPKDDFEYGRRNLLHCMAVGAHANARVAWLRLRRQKSAPKWLVAYLSGIVDRTGPVANEMAVHRDEVW